MTHAHSAPAPRGRRGGGSWEHVVAVFDAVLAETMRRVRKRSTAVALVAVGVLFTAGCLDGVGSVLFTTGSYPTFVALRVRDSVALPRSLSSATADVVPSGIIDARAAQPGDSALWLSAIARGFAQWRPVTGTVHPIWVAVFAGRRSDPQLVAHHGVSLVAPENTLSAVRAACEHGIPSVEVDVRFTRDSVPVLIHDRDVSRTSNGSGFVDLLTLSELKRLDFGSWFGPKFAGETIPTLAEFLALGGVCGLDAIQLDVKAFGPLSIDTGWARIARDVRTAGLTSAIEVGAADLGWLTRAHLVFPEARRVLFALSVSPSYVAAIETSMVDAVSIDYEGYVASAASLASLDSNGVKLGVAGLASPLLVNDLRPFPAFIISDWNWRFDK